MRIIFDQQDLIDAICVEVATDYNEGLVQDSEPHFVKNVEIFFNDIKGFSASAWLFRCKYNLSQQKIIDAVALYLSGYHSFVSELLLIDLQYDEATKAFGAEIIAKR